jgi:hypothetical protein
MVGQQYGVPHGILRVFITEAQNYYIILYGYLHLPITHFFSLQLEPTKECLKAVQKMNSCPACQGYPELKPCSNYCINVMKGCLVFHIELQDQWDSFITSLASLSERLLG